MLPLIRTEKLSRASLPSVSEFHRVNRCSDVLEPRVADCHRRFGLSPTPEHVLFFILSNVSRAGKFLLSSPHGGQLAGRHLVDDQIGDDPGRDGATQCRELRLA